MQKTKPVRYALLILMFALALVGIITHSTILLAVLMIVGIALGVTSEVIENRPTEPYKEYNHMHNRHGQHDVQS